MSSARKATRSGMGVVRLWMTDISTMPLLVCAGIAAVAGTATAARSLSKNPDVRISKTKRTNAFHYTATEGDEWRERRLDIARSGANPINQHVAFNGLATGSAANASDNDV